MNNCAAALVANRREPELACDLARKVVAAHPSLPAAKLNLASALLLAEQSDEAERVMRAIPSTRLRDRERWVYHLNQGELYFQKGKLGEALTEWRKVKSTWLFPKQLARLEDQQERALALFVQ